MTAPNAGLAYAVLDHLDAHPEQWNQGRWIGKAECGTVGCFAGWAVMLSGAEPDMRDGWDPGRGYVYTCVVTFDGNEWLVSLLAEHLLGASRYVEEGTDHEIDLFAEDNTREDLGRLVAEIFGPRPNAGSAS